MEIHHFPEVQILGNHAQIREGKHYIDLGIYNGDGSFEWSPEGIRRRDALLQEWDVAEGERLEAAGPIEDQLHKDSLAEELAAAKLRNSTRLKKQSRAR